MPTETKPKTSEKHAPGISDVPRHHVRLMHEIMNVVTIPGGGRHRRGYAMASTEEGRNAILSLLPTAFDEAGISSNQYQIGTLEGSNFLEVTLVAPLTPEQIKKGWAYVTAHSRPHHVDYKGEDRTFYQRIQSETAKTPTELTQSM